MKILIDLLPLVAFFVAYKLKGIYVATGVVMVATALQMLYLKLSRQPIEPMNWVVLVMVMVFGSATLLLQNEIYIKLRPTAVNWIFALALAAGPLIFKKNFLQPLLGKMIQSTDAAWKNANIAAIIYFVGVGLLNLLAVQYLSTEQWVNFKIFVLWGINIVFFLGLTVYLLKHGSTIESTQAAQASNPENTPHEPR